MFEIVGLLIGIIATIVICSIAFIAIKALREWSKNNKLPVKSKVLAKNSETTYHNSNNDNFSSSSRTVRTITFQDSLNNTRRVFRVRRDVFDLTVEGDVGTLVHQGTRFHSFNICQ
ncbi:MAG: DUF2500 family protein [Gammaproteobacteria bacterium]|nr:DUF2500 family protein [Gammaproteobacteria bacterium]